MKTGFVLLLSPLAVTGFSARLTSNNGIRSESAVGDSLLKRPSVALHASTVADEIETAQDNDVEGKPATSYLDDGFIFGLEGSGLERPKGKTAQVVVEGDDLETKPYQVALVSLTMIGHAAIAGTAIQEMLATNGGNAEWTTLQVAALLVSSWIFADFGSGVLHWSVDNYGNGRTPIMGNIIAAFQGHHSAPWTITQRGFCNNVHKLCYPFGVPTMAVLSFLTGPFTTLFLTNFCVLEIMSQEFHKWSHQTKGEVPAFVNALQSVGLTIDRKPHAQHHMAPYEGNYCIVSGVCNGILDQSGFFRKLEHMVYEWNGVESNSWKLDANLKERTLRGEYALPVE